VIAWPFVSSPAARSGSAWRGSFRDDAEPVSKEKPGNCSPFCPCEPIPSAAADRYAKVKASQQRRGLPLDENDLWIAAAALVMNAILVSRDSDTQAIEGLALVEA